MEIVQAPFIKKGKLKRYAREIFRLKEKYGRELKAKEVFHEAKPKTSPLHDWFDWDVKQGWEKWNIHKARMLICHVRIRVLDEDGRKVQARALWNVRLERDEKPCRGYVSLDEVRYEPTLRHQIINEGVDKLEEWMRRYAVYIEFEQVRAYLKKSVPILRSRMKKKAAVVAG